MAIFKIRKMIMKSLFGKPATLMYPVQEREYTKKTRGHVEIDIDTCIFCGICARKCPTGAIGVNRNEKEWSIERLRCIQCGCCADLCPKKCLEVIGKYTEPSTEGSIKDVFHARVSDNPTDSQTS